MEQRRRNLAQSAVYFPTPRGRAAAGTQPCPTGPARIRLCDRQERLPRLAGSARLGSPGLLPPSGHPGLRTPEDSLSMCCVAGSNRRRAATPPAALHRLQAAPPSHQAQDPSRRALPRLAGRRHGVGWAARVGRGWGSRG